MVVDPAAAEARERSWSPPGFTDRSRASVEFSVLVHVSIAYTAFSILSTDFGPRLRQRRMLTSNLSTS